MRTLCPAGLTSSGESAVAELLISRDFSEPWAESGDATTRGRGSTPVRADARYATASGALMSVAVADQFQSLYRRYRPQRFSEVRGQGHVVLGLRNAVRDDRVAHAYLFSGPRGTGKTSTARILAKALNCAKPEDGEPCGKCDSCVDIARGASLDVHELDAASNNGVDAMRDLVARASLATPGKWKVYIVDEVHMLSTAASNALLKTLEEPPDHVVFVLATTDPQKVLPTIRSRTQHFEFHLLEVSTLEALLTEIAEDANLELPDDGIEAAVRRAHGSARDALSALDLVVAAGVVEDDGRWVRELITAIAERDTKLVLHTVAAATVAGFDASRLATELVDGLRELFLSSMAPELRRPGSAPLSDSTSDATARTAAPPLGPARCVRALEAIGTAIVDMREALDARTTFEVTLVRLTHPEVDDGPAALLERIERLERRVQELASGGGAGATAASTRPAPSELAARAPAAHDSAPAAHDSAPAAQDSPPAAQDSPPAPTTGSLPGASPALGAYLRPREAQNPAPVIAASPSPAAADTVAEPPAGVPSAVPTRDDLVTAWGDHVLPSLRPRARAVFAVGRFVAVQDGVAVFALPNSAHVEHATPLVTEVAEAISRQVAATVGLRLITENEVEPPAGGGASTPADPPTAARPGAPGVDPGQSPESRAAGRPQSAAARVATAAAVSPPQTGPEDDEVDLDDLAPGEAAGPHDSASWAEGRLREAFPGAEEVP
jgi:DNA polymerase III subunit gamma/tau